MNIVTLLGIFIVGTLCGSTIALCRRSARLLIAENAVDAGNASRRVNDLMTVLGAPLFHPNDNRSLTTEERVEWIQARVGWMNYLWMPPAHFRNERPCLRTRFEYADAGPAVFKPSGAAQDARTPGNIPHLSELLSNQERLPSWQSRPWVRTTAKLPPVCAWAQRSIASATERLLRHASLKVTTDVYMQAVSPQKREAQSKLVKMVLKKTASK